MQAAMAAAGLPECGRVDQAAPAARGLTARYCADSCPLRPPAAGSAAAAGHQLSAQMGPPTFATQSCASAAPSGPSASAVRPLVVAAWNSGSTVCCPAAPGRASGGDCPPYSSSQGRSLRGCAGPGLSAVGQGLQRPAPIRAICRAVCSPIGVFKVATHPTARTPSAAGRQGSKKASICSRAGLANGGHADDRKLSCTRKFWVRGPRFCSKPQRYRPGGCPGYPRLLPTRTSLTIYIIFLLPAG